MGVLLPRVPHTVCPQVTSITLSLDDSSALCPVGPTGAQCQPHIMPGMGGENIWAQVRGRAWVLSSSKTLVPRGTEA